ncbi:Golgi-associated plant pathogenesis-related protein 1-like [Ptychodera flava]|uniref:Golgi-associated plant pathogenesis-related protein 1-like n=1 Tax=Ptychodera flava TaxID=63121 RepID=UPI00396A48F2
MPCLAAVLIVLLTEIFVAEAASLRALMAKNEIGNGVIYGEGECAVVHPDHPLQCEDRSGHCMSQDLMCDGFIVCDKADDEKQECGWGETDAKGCKKPDTIGNTGVDDLKQQILEAQKYFRCLHGVQPLKWDDELAAAAQHVADDNAARFELEHSTMKYGENIDFIGLSSGEGQTGYGYTLHWYNEIAEYKWGNSRPYGAYRTFHTVGLEGHRYRGCAFATSRTVDSFTYYFAVCEYWPPGNFLTTEAYQKNVLPPL